MEEPAIQIDGLTRNFGRRRAVDDVTLRVDRAEIFGFLGPNGAGKTTTIRCMLGLAKPTSGDVRLFGRSVARDRIAALEGVGSLVEGPALYSHLHAVDHLRACAFHVGDGVELDPHLALAEVGLADRAEDRVSTLSRGMKQRLAVATALLGRPRLLVLDEPTDGLDPLATVEMRRMFRRLRDRGVTLFLSSHLLAEVSATCDRVAVLDRGQLRAVGTVAALTADRSLEDFFLATVEGRTEA